MTPGTPAPGSKTIEIIVQPDGQASVQTKGFTGPSCRDASRFIERALGKATGEQLTPEFHQTQPHQEQNRERA